MFKTKNKIICTICMREGSKGIKNKNLLKINNKDLMSYTINQAKISKMFERIVVSSNSKKIIKTAKKYNLSNYILRSNSISNNRISKIPAIIDAVKKTEKKFSEKYDYVVDLDITSPLRKKEDIILSVKKILKLKRNNLITVTNCRKNPYFNMVEYNNNKLNLCKKIK